MLTGQDPTDEQGSAHRPEARLSGSETKGPAYLPPRLHPPPPVGWEDKMAM